MIHNVVISVSVNSQILYDTRKCRSLQRVALFEHNVSSVSN